MLEKTLAGRFKRPFSAKAGITLVAAAMIGIMVVVGAVLFDVMVVYRAKEEAQTAADAAAKAAGLELTPLFGVGDDPAGAAYRFAEANGAEVLSVETGGEGSRLWVSVKVRRACNPLFINLGRGAVWITATARVYMDPIIQ